MLGAMEPEPHKKLRLRNCGFNCPRKMQSYKVVTVRVKTFPRTWTAQRLFPRYATKKILTGIRVVAKSAGSEEPVFTSWMRYPMDPSWGSSRLPSRDTVPLSFLAVLILIKDRSKSSVDNSF
jgi:hypothetical protein